MLTNTHKPFSPSVSPVRVALFLLIVFFLFVVSVKSQTAAGGPEPPWHAYRGVTLGMTSGEVREKLGTPKKEDATGFFYIFSETENAQFLLDANDRVRTISVVYEADSNDAPSFEAVFGKTAALEPRPDGSCFKMMRYPGAGYWISYNRMAGDKAMVIVLIQKI